MSPPRTNPRAGRDGDDIVVLIPDVGVAGKFGVVDILNGEVARRSPHTTKLALVGTVHRNLLEDGMGAGRGRESENTESLHLGFWLGWSRAEVGGG